MSALLVSEVSTQRDYWRNTAVTLTKIQSSWRRILVDRSYHIGPFLVGWSVQSGDNPLGRVVGVPSLWPPGGVRNEHGMGVLRQIEAEQANFRVARHSPTVKTGYSSQRPGSRETQGKAVTICGLLASSVPWGTEYNQCHVIILFSAGNESVGGSHDARNNLSR